MQPSGVQAQDAQPQYILTPFMSPGVYQQQASGATGVDLGNPYANPAYAFYQNPTALQAAASSNLTQGVMNDIYSGQLQLAAALSPTYPQYSGLASPAAYDPTTLGMNPSQLVSMPVSPHAFQVPQAQGQSAAVASGVGLIQPPGEQGVMQAGSAENAASGELGQKKRKQKKNRLQGDAKQEAGALDQSAAPGSDQNDQTLATLGTPGQGAADPVANALSYAQATSRNQNAFGNQTNSGYGFGGRTQPFYGAGPSGATNTYSNYNGGSGGYTHNQNIGGGGRGNWTNSNWGNRGRGNWRGRGRGSGGSFVTFTTGSRGRGRGAPYGPGMGLMRMYPNQNQNSSQSQNTFGGTWNSHTYGTGAAGSGSPGTGAGNRATAGANNSNSWYNRALLTTVSQLESIQVSAGTIDDLRGKVNPTQMPDLVNNFPRFFVIKSFCEDDVHHSVKYSVWCSTERGNRILDFAYRQAQSGGQPQPIYLFFSVNGSGHFCGIARMASEVDYERKLGNWEQDRWRGVFTVEWVYVKDVPNSELRGILLPNNDNRPVTYSRDTQEVPLDLGRKVFDIIHKYQSTTSLFDDFDHYEERERSAEQNRAQRNPFAGQSTVTTSSANQALFKAPQGPGQAGGELQNANAGASLGPNGEPVTNGASGAPGGESVFFSGQNVPNFSETYSFVGEFPATGTPAFGAIEGQAPPESGAIYPAVSMPLEGDPAN